MAEHIATIYKWAIKTAVAIFASATMNSLSTARLFHVTSNPIAGHKDFSSLSLRNGHIDNGRHYIFVNRDQSSICCEHNLERGIIFEADCLYYEGMIKGRNPHGRGRMIWRDSNESDPARCSVYEGQFLNGRATGRGTYTDSSLKLAGDWRFGAPLKGKV